MATDEKLAASAPGGIDMDALKARVAQHHASSGLDFSNVEAEPVNSNSTDLTPEELQSISQYMQSSDLSPDEVAKIQSAMSPQAQPAAQPAQTTPSAGNPSPSGPVGPPSLDESIKASAIDKTPPAGADSAPQNAPTAAPEGVPTSGQNSPSTPQNSDDSDLSSAQGVLKQYLAMKKDQAANHPAQAQPAQPSQD